MAAKGCVVSGCEMEAIPKHRVCEKHYGKVFASNKGTPSKVCTKCNKVKPESNFGRDGHNKNCTDCLGKPKKKPTAAASKQADGSTVRLERLRQKRCLDILQKAQKQVEEFNRCVDEERATDEQRLEKLGLSMQKWEQFDLLRDDDELYKVGQEKKKELENNVDNWLSFKAELNWISCKKK
jgi:hypothetical protein